MDAADWDHRYADADLVWGAEPNRFVAEQTTDLTPGTALDVACGEGRNAIWLARRGWDATGIDFSAVAVARARQLAEQAEVAERAHFAVADVVAGELPVGPFDLVIVAYLHLPPGDLRAVLRRLADHVAPGGTLLVIGHDRRNLTEGTGGPQDPAILYTPEELSAALDGSGLVVHSAERVLRPVGEATAIDTLLRAARAA